MRYLEPIMCCIFKTHNITLWNRRIPKAWCAELLTVRGYGAISISLRVRKIMISALNLMSRAARPRSLALALASVAFVGFLGSANASVVTVSGSALSFGSTNNSNDVIHTQQGYFGANLSV